MARKTHYDNLLADPRPDSTLSAIFLLWAWKEWLPTGFEAHAPEMRRAAPRVRADFERTLVAHGLPESSVDDPAVQEILGFATGYVFSHAPPAYDRLLSRRGPAPFREDGTYSRQFCVRVVGATCTAFKCADFSYDDVANFLNSDSRGSNLDRHHVRRAFKSYVRWAAKDAASAGFDRDGWLFMDMIDAAVVMNTLERAKQLPGLRGLKGAALVSALVDKCDFQEQFDAASRDPRALTADAPWRRAAGREA